MKINALLDVNVVAHEATDEIAVLLELEAPAALADVTRPQASLQVVLDRAGRWTARRWRAPSRRSSRWSAGWSRPTTSGWSPSTTPPRSSSQPGR